MGGCFEFVVGWVVDVEFDDWLIFGFEFMCMVG